MTGQRSTQGPIESEARCSPFMHAPASASSQRVLPCMSILCTQKKRTQIVSLTMFYLDESMEYKGIYVFMKREREKKKGILSDFLYFKGRTSSLLYRGNDLVQVGRILDFPHSAINAILQVVFTPSFKLRVDLRSHTLALIDM